MYKKRSGTTNKFFFFIIVCIVLVVVITGWQILKKTEKVTENTIVNKEKNIPVSKQVVIDYGKIEEKTETASLMEKRKAEFGLEKSIDMIVKSDELLKVGNSTVAMQTIIDKIRLKSGEIVEKTIFEKNNHHEGSIETFGIYVVQKKDNIWNIHFKFLKDYFEHRGISIEPTSDEPNNFGYSSGVGKLLKFSEHIVNIYNIKENRLDADINLIQPLNKLVIYNMTQIFALLDSIEYNTVNHIQFDGETLWVSSER